MASKVALLTEKWGKLVTERPVSSPLVDGDLKTGGTCHVKDHRENIPGGHGKGEDPEAGRRLA